MKPLTSDDDLDSSSHLCQQCSHASEYLSLEVGNTRVVRDSCSVTQVIDHEGSHFPLSTNSLQGPETGEIRLSYMADMRSSRLTVDSSIHDDSQPVAQHERIKTRDRDTKYSRGSS